MEAGKSWRRRAAAGLVAQNAADAAEAAAELGAFLWERRATHGKVVRYEHMHAI